MSASSPDPQIKNVLELIASKKGLNQYLIHRTGQLNIDFIDSGSDLQL